ncbi:MAG: PAS domain S-box protein [Acidobacteriota bacterium]
MDIKIDSDIQQDFRAILEASELAVIVTTPDGTVTYWSRAAESLYIWKSDEAIGRNIMEMVIPSPAFEEEADQFIKQLRTGKSWTGDFTVKRKDGVIFPVSVTNSPIYSSENELTAIVSISQDITERKRADEQLIRNESKYRFLVEQASDGIHTYDAEGRFIDTNSKFCEMLGYTREELTELKVQDLVPAEDLAIEPIRFDDLLAGRTILRERRLRRKNGTSFIAEISGKMIQPGVLQASIRDVSERRKAHSLLDAQKQALEMVVTDAPLDAILSYLVNIVDELGNGRSVSSILLLDEDNRLRNGASPGLPDHYLKAIDGIAADANVGTCSSAAATGKTVITPDIASDARWVGLAHLPLQLDLQAAWTMPILAKDGSVLGTFGTYFRELREPTAFELQVVELLSRTAALAIERKEADEQRRQDQERLRSIFESFQDGIIVEQAETVVYVNNSYLRIFGYSGPDEVIGRDISIVISSDDTDRLREFGRLRDRGETAPAHYEFKGKRKDGTLVDVEVSVSSSISGGLRYTTTILRDVTERKLAEKAVRDSEAQLRLVTDAIPLLVSFVDAGLRYRIVNRAYSEWFERPHQEIVGEQMSDLLGTSAFLELQAEIRTALSGEEVTFERTIPYHTGERFVHVNYIPQRDSDTGEVVGFHSFVWDISARKAADLAMERSRSELEERVVERTFELKAAVKERIRVLQELVTAQEDERRRMARELHDQLGQQLTVLRLKLENVARTLADGSDPADRLEEIREITRELNASVDFLAWKFRPAVLDDIGIVAALDEYVQRWSVHFGIKAEFDARRFRNSRLDPEVETNCYRITQEALNNISKHAGATKVNVLLEPRDGGAVLIIEDNGAGFDPAESKRESRGMGLMGMSERAVLVGGLMEIESSAGFGTTIYVKVPGPLTRAEDQDGEH